MPRNPLNFKDATIHVPIAHWERVQAEARRSKRSVSGFILAAIIFYCDHLYLERKAKRLHAQERRIARQLTAPPGDLENDGNG